MAKLLGSADPTLVRAATYAAMANVPKDLSGVHERLSKSHERTMKIIGESWVKGITGALKVGQKLVEQAKKFNVEADYTDSYAEPTEDLETAEMESPEDYSTYKQEQINNFTPSTEFETLKDFEASIPDYEEWKAGTQEKKYKFKGFDDRKISNWNKELEDLKKAEFGQEGRWSHVINIDTFQEKHKKGLANNAKEQEKLKKKIAKRTNKLKKKDWTTRIYTDSNDKEHIVEPRTVKGQLRKIRNEIADIRLDKTLKRQQREDKIGKLKIKKDNLRSSVVNFRTKLQVVTEQLKLGDIDILASSMGVDGSLGMQFTHALIAVGKPLGDDAKYTDSGGNVHSLAGARAQVGFTDEEGKMTFMFVDKYGMPIEKDDGSEMSIQIDDVQDLIVAKNPAIIEGFKDVTGWTNHYNRGVKGLAYDPSQTNNFIDKTVIDKNSALSAINHSDGDMTSSLVSALNGVKRDVNGNPVTGSTEMSDFFWEQLGGLGSEWDTDGVEGITAADFVGSDVAQVNFERLRDEVLKGEDIPLIRQLLKANTNFQNEKHNAIGLEKYNAAQIAARRTSTSATKTTEQITLFGQVYDAPSAFGNSRARYQDELSNVIKIANKEGVTIENQVFAWDTKTGKYKQTFNIETGRDVAVDYKERYTRRELVSRATKYYTVPRKYKGFDEAEAASTKIQKQAEEKLAKEQKAAQEVEANKMKVIESLFKEDADEDDALIKLKTAYPNLKISIKTEGKDIIFIDFGDDGGKLQFNLEGTDTSTIEMEMKRLKEKLQKKPE